MRRGSLALAVAASAAIILSAPVNGQLRGAVKAAFPEQFVTIVGAAMALALAGAVSTAIFRIRERRVFRVLMLGGAIVTGVAYARAVGTGNPDVDVVERVHFIEYGTLALLFYRVWRPRGDASMLFLPLCAGVLVGTLDEWCQWFIPDRVGEAHDVLINGAAIGCGLLFGAGLDPPARPMPPLRRESRARAGLGAAIVAIVFALFFQSVHIGHDVRDRYDDRFRSAFSASELEDAVRDRAERWRVQPPVALRRWSREDHYLSEGWWHVQARNKAVTDGHPRIAWRENLILEQFFGPVLDAPTYVSATGHRWTAEQRTNSAAAMTEDHGPYTSSANPYSIYDWPRTIYWSVVVGLGLAVLWLTNARAALR